MNHHPNKRRPYGYDHDPSEQLLEDPSLIPFQRPIVYPFQSQPFPSPGQNAIIQAEDGIHISYESFGVIGDQYQQPQDHDQAYQEQHQQQCYPQVYTPYNPRKRQRIETNMPTTSPLFSQGHPGQDEHEKSPLSGHPEREDDCHGSLMGAFGRCLSSIGMCPPYSTSTYETATAYQPIPSTGYGGAVARAYSSGSQSPVRTQAPGPTQHGLFDMEEQTHNPHLQGYPALQPVSQYGSQPTTGPETMVYPNLEAEQGYPKPETSPVFFKSEAVGQGQGFHSPDFQNGPTQTGPIPMHRGDTNYAHASIPRAVDNSYSHHGLLNYQLSPRYSIPHGYVHTDELSPERVDQCQTVTQCDGLEVVLPNHKPHGTKRGPFKNQEKRQQTAHVRKIGSCIRCRMQRIRCETNTEAPEDDDAPCDGCKKILANSKIHRLPCRRWKITEVRLFKPGQVKGFEWTNRWQDGTAGPDIGQWASSDVKIIRLTEGYGDGVVLRVRRFVPQDGDKLARTWVEDGKLQSRSLEPYALIDLDAAKASYEGYLRSGSFKMRKALLGPTQELLWKTYEFALTRAHSPETTPEEKELIMKTLDLWAAVRLTTKSFEIIGEETLGVPRSKGPVPIPPVMGAQIDNILLNQTLPKLRRETLETLQSMTQAKKQKTWLTTYLVTFILLHNVALITAHDESYAKKHGMKTRFARKDMVEQYHLGANIFLAYYHYCNKSVYPFSNECKDSDLQNLAELDHPSMDFVKYTRSYADKYKRQWDDLRAAREYGNDYYFISQLYDQHWSPQDTIIN